MGLTRLQVPPGVVKSNTPYTQPGRYIDAQWVRFQSGLPESRGGRELLDPGIPPFKGLVRGAEQWEDNSGNKRIGFGTSASKFYVYDNGELYDVTPFRRLSVGNLTNPLTVTSGSSIVTVFDTAHLLKVNEWVQLTADTPVGGLLVAGVYLVQSVVDADHYTIDAGVAATSAATGGGNVVYTYYHQLLGPNPFATTAGSPNVVVSHPNRLPV
jgi:hypothetical protein